MATPVETIRAAVLGNPPDPLKQPDNAMVVQAFEEMNSLVETLQNGVKWLPTDDITKVIRVRATGNVAIATALENGDTLNGVTLATGDHVFLPFQTAPAENGIYTVPASGAAARATFADSAAELALMGIVLQAGTAGQGERWVLTKTAAEITLGTTALIWSFYGIEPGFAAEVADARGGFAQLVGRLDGYVQAGGVSGLPDAPAPGSAYSLAGPDGRVLAFIDRRGRFINADGLTAMLPGTPHTAMGKQHLTVKPPGSIDIETNFMAFRDAEDFPIMWSNRAQFPAGPIYEADGAVITPSPLARQGVNRPGSFAIYPFPEGTQKAQYDARTVGWRTRSVPDANEWRSVAYSPSLRRLAAVASTGTGNRVMTSDDWGRSWTARTSPADNNWRSICWATALNLFVAVAYSGTGDRVMTSPDGITWTTRTSAADNEWLSVCWSPELALLVAVANTGTTSNQVMTSPDGINWTARSTPSTRTWRSVCWAAALGLFVAVAASGTTTRVMTSPDGTTWTLRNAAADNAWEGVCWSPDLELLVAVATSGTGNRVMTSPDGIAWTARATPTDLNWQSVCWAADRGMFVTVAVSGTNRVAVSADGISWTQQAADQGGWRTVIYLADVRMFAAVATAGPSYVMSSTDQFTLRATPRPGQSLGAWSHSGGPDGQAWGATLEFAGQNVSDLLHMFNGGLWLPGVDGDDPVDAAEQATLVPAVDALHNIGPQYDADGDPTGRTIAQTSSSGGIAYMIRRALGADGYKFGSRWAMASISIGAQSIEYFLPPGDGGTSDWFVEVYEATCANFVTVSPGYVVEIDDITVMHGEADSNSMAEATYRGHLDDWDAALRASAKTATGQSHEPIVAQSIITNPLNTIGAALVSRPQFEVSDVALAVLKKGTSLDSGDAYYIAVGPYYDESFVSISHLTTWGYVHNDERMGYVLNEHKRLVDIGQQAKWLPAHVTDGELVTEGGRSFIKLQCHVPFGPLVIDTHIIPLKPDWGFHIRGGSNTPEIVGCTIGDTGDTIWLELSVAWTGTGRVVGVAAKAQEGRQGWLTDDETPASPWQHQGMACNVRDSAPWSSVVTGKRLANWMCPQLVEIAD